MVGHEDAIISRLIFNSWSTLFQATSSNWLPSKKKQFASKQHENMMNAQTHS